MKKAFDRFFIELSFRFKSSYQNIKPNETLVKYYKYNLFLSGFRKIIFLKH